MKKLFIYFIVLSAPILAQPDFKIGQDIIQSGKYFNSEIHFFPSEQDYLVCYTYKISYSQLFFEKKNDQFTSGLSINIEIKDSTGNTFKRAFDDRKISVNNFDITISPTAFLQGVIKLNLPVGKYKLLTIIYDQISKRERRIPPKELIINNSIEILNPLVLDAEIFDCDGQESFIISNNSSSIPFNKPSNYLAIPVSDSKIKYITISINKGDTALVTNERISESFSTYPEIILCNGKAVIKPVIDTMQVKVFLIKSFSSNLREGPIQLEIYTDENINNKMVDSLNVIWISKPESLKDPESAIKLLETIESKEVVSELLSKNGSYQNILFEYWKSKDPTPGTIYNELMNEYYTRVDFCEMNFKTISGNGGAKSDRGNIYIKFGAPDSINRDTNSSDKVVESWFYKKSNRKFVFIDREGIGKFQLTDGK